MSLRDRITRIENRMDTHERIRSIEQDIITLEARLRALAEYQNLQFKREAVIVVGKSNG